MFYTINEYGLVFCVRKGIGQSGKYFGKSRRLYNWKG